jgi:NAD(P)-dependent dehydrogenase (short-subunit alcohol dehydrogenase family)
MDLGLEGKVAVVTGASKGIGLAVVHALAGEGMHVVGGALTVDSLGGIERVTPVAVDLVEPEGSARLVREAVERHGRIDVLVNNVGGVKLRLDGFLAISDDDFEASMQLNFFAALRATRAAVTAMLEQGGGTIVNVASVNSFFHPDGLVIDYGAAKAALLNVAEALSQELGPKGIRINSISPGPVATELWLGDHGVAATIAAATGTDAATVRDQAIAGMATGRFTTPEEVATLVALLASPRTGNVTGSNYVIDGGLVKTM